MNAPFLTPGMAESETLKPVTMTPARVADIQLACEAVVAFANLYRAVPHHPAVEEYRTARFAQFVEAYEALKGLIDE